MKSGAETRPPQGSFTTGSLCLFYVAQVISLFLCREALAFDLYPEFHALTESDHDHIENAKLIDSEYQSDYVTFLPPLAWERDFFLTPVALDYSLGSLSFTHFMQRTRARLSKELLPGDLSFRFTYFSERDHETDQTHAVFELIKPLTSRLALSAYGEPSYHKRENDFGLAVLLFPGPKHEVRLFHTWVDLTRALHNDRPDYFVEGSEPRSLGVVGRCGSCLGEESWLEYFMRWQTPTEWRFPTKNAEYDYASETIGLAFHQTHGTPIAGTNFRFEASRSNEGNAPLNSSSTVVRQRMDHRRFESLANVEISSEQFTYEPGFGWFTRSWRDENGRTLVHENAMPFIWLRRKGPERLPGLFDEISVGYELTFFHAHGDFKLAAEELKAFAVEHRANFRYEFALKDGATFGLLVSADIDALVRGSGGLFEGGHGWLKVSF